MQKRQNKLLQNIINKEISKHHWFQKIQYPFHNEYGISDKTRVFMNNLKFHKKFGQISIAVMRPEIASIKIKDISMEQSSDLQQEDQEETYIKNIGSAYIQFNPRDLNTQKMMYNIKLIYWLQNRELNQIIQYDIERALKQEFTYTTRGEYPIQKSLSIFQSEKDPKNISLNYKQQNINNFEDFEEIQLDLYKQEFVTIQSALKSVNPLFFGWGYELKAIDLDETTELQN